jgi:hypothetical protein
MSTNSCFTVPFSSLAANVYTSQLVDRHSTCTLGPSTSAYYLSHRHAHAFWVYYFVFGRCPSTPLFLDFGILLVLPSNIHSSLGAATAVLSDSIIFLFPRLLYQVSLDPVLSPLLPALSHPHHIRTHYDTTTGLPRHITLPSAIYIAATRCF